MKRNQKNVLTFKQREQLFELANNVQSLYSTDDSVAFVVLMRICRDYVSKYSFPLINGKDRDEWLLERLKNYRIKYIDSI